MQHDSTKYHIAKLIYKSIAKINSDQEKIDINTWLSDNKNLKLYNKITSSSAINQKMDLYNQTNPEKIYKRLEHQILAGQKSNGKTRYLNLYKYAAAVIVVGILTTTFVFRDNLFTSPIDTNPIIVNTEVIVPGTDKATLTLEDGSVVELDKGNNYQTQNASSNGAEIVYAAEKGNSKEIAYNVLTIPRGGEFFIKLSDGTQVWLNSESQLKYPVSFKEGEVRIVDLVYGEAYFNVSPSTEHKGARFKVLNKSQEVEVLGTEFNIKAYKDETNIYTTLVEGKVALNFNGKTQNLKPSQQSNFNISTNKVHVLNVDVYNEISWKEGVFSFERAPLKDIMKVLSRWYDFEVIILNKEIEKTTFSGVLGKDQNIEGILTTIRNFKIIKEYEIKEKTIILN